MYQPITGQVYKEPTITMDDMKLNVMKKFTYIDSTHSQNATILDNVHARLAKACSIFD